ncbi:hypothetical protein [Mycolicibacterium sp. XJ870]
MTTKPDEPGEEELFEKSLRKHGQLAESESESDEPPAGSTHQVTTDESGERKVVRKRFSAI